MRPDYFLAFDDRSPPELPPLSAGAQMLWHMLAGITIGLGIWYLAWRWSNSLNPEALIFSSLVAAAETAAFLGTLLFFFDIWREQDTPQKPPPKSRSEAGLDGDGQITIDIFITTYDEGPQLVGHTLCSAQAVRAPANTDLRISLLDDGQQPGMADLAREFDVPYRTRRNNVGFKAGNLAAAMQVTRGDFIVICDADTRLLPSFLENTLGYFRDPKVAWVQTPHWFCDIPSGRSWDAKLTHIPRGLARSLAPMLGVLAGPHVGQDPFLADPAMFFDVIQRRRNRHSASFCCGAGSIHRREPLYENALARRAATGQRNATRQNANRLRVTRLEPFCFHVSEDILTSIALHQAGHRSVYHPKVEARMLSPLSVQAWATQHLKYAGGTFDIMLNHNPLRQKDMPWATKLHYAATFYSYLTLLWLPILLFAPAFSLLTGITPVDTYSLTFISHLIPLLLTNELALLVACKGHPTHAGRARVVCAAAIQARAVWAVLRGQQPRFPTTPKLPGAVADWSHARPLILALAFLAVSAVWGTTAYLLDLPGYSASMVAFNLFWVAWNASAMIPALRMARWQPKANLPVLPKTQGDKDVQPA